MALPYTRIRLKQFGRLDGADVLYHVASIVISTGTGLTDSADAWKEWDVTELLALTRHREWVLDQCLHESEAFLVEGWFGDHWQTLSWWRQKEDLRSPAKTDTVSVLPETAPQDVSTAADLRRVIASTMGYKPLKGEAAHHLLDHVGVPPEAAIPILRAVYGPGAVTKVSIAALRRDGKKRSKPCRFCEIS